MTRSTRVALHNPRGVGIVPLTKPSPKPRTISLRASTEPQSTKPSRRWQPPRVTSTPALQHEHLVPLDAISQSNALDSHSQSICNLTSTSELEGSQAKHYHGKHILKVLNLFQDPGTLLFIEEGRKLAVTPFSRALTTLLDCP
jgi:hypothetical protein